HRDPPAQRPPGRAAPAPAAPAGTAQAAGADAADREGPRARCAGSSLGPADGTRRGAELPQLRAAVVLVRADETGADRLRSVRPCAGARPAATVKGLSATGSGPGAVPLE